MSQIQPTKATFSRDEIEKRIRKSLAEDEVSNVNNTDDILESIDERLCETNDLLWQLVKKETNPTRKEERGLITQEDVDNYMNSVKDYYVFDDKGNCKENTMSSKSKKVNLKSRERYLIYKALGSRISTMRNQIGYSRVDEDESLKDQINKAENLMEKIKNS